MWHDNGQNILQRFLRCDYLMNSVYIIIPACATLPVPELGKTDSTGYNFEREGYQTHFTLMRMGLAARLK